MGQWYLSGSKQFDTDTDQWSWPMHYILDQNSLTLIYTKGPDLDPNSLTVIQANGPDLDPNSLTLIQTNGPDQDPV